VKALRDLRFSIYSFKERRLNRARDKAGLRELNSDFDELPSGLPSALRLRLEESLTVEGSRVAASAVLFIFTPVDALRGLFNQPTRPCRDIMWPLNDSILR
jgi:hypothetical protein